MLIWELPFTILISETSLLYLGDGNEQARFWISERLFRILQTAFSPDALDFPRLQRQHSPQGFACSRNFCRNAYASALSVLVIFRRNGPEEIRRSDNEHVHLARRDAPSQGPGLLRCQELSLHWRSAIFSMVPGRYTRPPGSVNSAGCTDCNVWFYTKLRNLYSGCNKQECYVRRTQCHDVKRLKPGPGELQC